MATGSIHVERRALYYPWVNFHSDEWVKKALLVFPGMFRMVSQDQMPRDSLLVCDLRGGGLIRHADLNTPNAAQAQFVLNNLIAQDLAANEIGYKSRFGKRAARASGQPSFQMNPGKTSGGLFDLLMRHELAWKPDDPEYGDYQELHPDLGQAVMGTIAMACAQDAGLHILGVDSPRGKDMSSELNITLASEDIAGPYKRFVRKETQAGPGLSGADELFHTLIQVNCDVSRLDASSLVKLQSEREPLRVLKQRAQEIAAQIPQMKDRHLREEAFRDRTNDIVKQWQKDRANLSNFAKTVFSLEAVGGGAAKAFDVMRDKLMPLSAGLSVTGVFNITAGLAIGLLTHTGVSWLKVKKQEADSPWRYLTLAEGEGATFSISSTRDE